VLDLLSIRGPDTISQFEREGDIGLGDLFSLPFQIPFQTTESIIPLEDGGLLLLNDNNYPLSAVRNPDEPDDTEAIIIRLDAPLNSPPIRQMPGTGGP
jgi:glycerophosphoryl diester phosphodiesterase